MNPIVTGLTLGLDLVELLYKQYLEHVKTGLITVEEQASVAAKMDRIRSGDAFNDPAYKLSTET